jgi:hypothetical protein
MTIVPKPFHTARILPEVVFTARVGYHGTELSELETQIIEKEMPVVLCFI